MTPAINTPGPFPQIPVPWKGFQVSLLRQYIKVPTRSESVTNSGPDKTLLSPTLECAAVSPSPSPPEWILDPDKPRTLLNRILAHILLAEAKEPNPHYRDDYHIAWITCKWAFDGVRQPHVAATYRVLGVHPNLVWNHILADRQAKLAGEFSLWYDAAGNLRPDAPKKPVTSSADGQGSDVNAVGRERGMKSDRLSADSVPSPKKETA